MVERVVSIAKTGWASLSSTHPAIALASPVTRPGGSAHAEAPAQVHGFLPDIAATVLLLGFVAVGVAVA